MDRIAGWVEVMECVLNGRTMGGYRWGTAASKHYLHRRMSRHGVCHWERGVLELCCVFYFGLGRQRPRIWRAFFLSSCPHFTACYILFSYSLETFVFRSCISNTACLSRSRQWLAQALGVNGTGFGSIPISVPPYFLQGYVCTSRFHREDPVSWSWCGALFRIGRGARCWTATGSRWGFVCLCLGSECRSGSSLIADMYLRQRD